MIPKIIHYCWFGKQEHSLMLKKCMLSWKKYCPKYEIIEWNEDNSNQFSNAFYLNSIRKKKYAFAADYIRTMVLYKYGGIYLDTDMLLLKPIDELLQYNFFSGFEIENRVAYGFYGGVKKHRFFSNMLNFYSNVIFDEFNPPIITHTFKKLINLNTIQKNELLLSSEYFYPLTFQNREKDFKEFITENSYAVHLWNHSWKLEEKKGYSFIFNKVKIVFLDYLFFGYPFNYLKRHLKDIIISFYRLIRYKSF